MKHKKSVLTVFILVLAVGLFMALGQGSQKAWGAKDTIVIGNTNPYSGPASAYGTIGKAIEAYFKKINAEGGINGRQIKFISYDDGYSPPKTVEQVRKLVEKDKVDILFQNLGTPTNSAIHKYVNMKKIPHLFLATGASKWGNPKEFPWTMGWQPNYQIAGRIYGNYIAENVPKAKIGILYQNDDYGKDYVVGFKQGLAEGVKARGLSQADAPKVIMELSYEVADPTVDSQIINLKASGANVFFNVTTPKFAAQAIRKAYDIGWKPVHIVNDVSNSIAAVLKPAGLEKSKGILSAFYLKDPVSAEWKDDPATKVFKKFMNTWVPKGSRNPQFNVLGYSASQTLVHVLKLAGDDLSRENIMKQAANIRGLVLPMLLPGIKVNTSPTDFFPIEQMQMFRFDGTTWISIGPIIGPSD